MDREAAPDGGGMLITVEQEDGVQALGDTMIIGLFSDAPYPHGANGTR